MVCCRIDNDSVLELCGAVVLHALYSGAINTNAIEELIRLFGGTELGLHFELIRLLVAKLGCILFNFVFALPFRALTNCS